MGSTSWALRSGQSTPRSGIGASGADGSSSAASGGAAGAVWPRAGALAIAAEATAPSSRAAIRLDPHPLIKRADLASAPERRQSECDAQRWPWPSDQLRKISDLMDCALDLVAAQRRDHAFNLPPVAKVHDIAVVAAALGPRRRLEAGVLAIALDQLGRVGQREPAMDERAVHAVVLRQQAFRDCGQISSTPR